MQPTSQQQFLKFYNKDIKKNNTYSPYTSKHIIAKFKPL